MKQFTYYCMDCDRHLCDECYKTHLSRHKEKTTYKLSEVLTSNKDVLYLVNLLMKEYHKDNYSVFKVIKEIAKLNTHKAFDEKEETVLNYLNSFSFGSLKPFWTISTNNFRVLFLFTLKDFRIAIVLDDQTIKIYDIVTQKCDITIQREKNSHCMCAQLDNGSIVSLEKDKKNDY